MLPVAAPNRVGGLFGILSDEELHGREYILSLMPQIQPIIRRPWGQVKVCRQVFKSTTGAFVNEKWNDDRQTLVRKNSRFQSVLFFDSGTIRVGLLIFIYGPAKSSLQLELRDIEIHGSIHQLALGRIE